LSLDSVERMTSHVGISEGPSRVRQPEKRAVSRELDLRGRRADEIEPELDSYLNDASLAGLSEVRIIHGVGTGVVRNIVRDFVVSHPLVRSFRSGGRGEGGDGATIIAL
jgi:DNA mismatch repair protein MutS2